MRQSFELRDFGLVGGVALGYGAAAELAVVLRPTEAEPTFTPTAGIALAALVLLDRRHWPATIAALVTMGTLVDLGKGLPVAEALGLALAVTLQAVVSASLLRWLSPTASASRSRDVVAFAAAALLAGPALGSAAAATVSHQVSGAPWLDTMWTWWPSHAVGALVVGATIIAWQRDTSGLPARSRWEWAGVLGGVGALTALHAMPDPTRVAFLPLGLLLWAALRLGERGALNAGSVFAVVACLPASHGWGLWALGPEAAGTGGPSLQVVLLVVVLGAWVVAVEVSGRERAEVRGDTEHDVATRLQRSLLPGELPSVPGIATAARYRPGDDRLSVGGDWYDLVLRPDGKIVAVVGDVVGHDLSAATAMGRLRSALAAIAVDAADPGEAFARLERFAAAQSPVAFATASYVELDPVSGLVRYACAGHPPPLAVTPDGEAAFLTGGRSLPLFAVSAGRRPVGETALEPGTLLVGYTDGLVERRERSLLAGLEELRLVVTQRRALPLDELADAVLADLTAGQHLHDDVALLFVALTARPVPETTASLSAAS